MKLIIDETTYTTLQNLSYAPQVDVTGSELPINTFEVDVITTDTITDGVFAELRDDRNRLYANYYITKAERQAANVVRVYAESPLALLDRITLQAVMYSSKNAKDAIDDCFTSLGPGFTVGIDYVVAQSLQSATITGYCPEQTARERLQWICFAIGAYVRTFKTTAVTIIPVDTTERLVPLEKTYFRPTQQINEWVTAIKITSFAFSQASSQADWENDDSSYRFPLPWVATEQEITLTNNDAPASAPENIVEISEMYLVNSGNVSAIASRLAAIHFKRGTVQLDAINNGDFWPGEKLIVYTDEDSMVAGMLMAETFAFGNQAKATMNVRVSETKTAATLVINYKYGDDKLDDAQYLLPVGYTYEIENPYLDIPSGGHRYIYRPQNTAATGTMSSGTNTNNQPYDIALDAEDMNLKIISVDDVTVQSSGNIAVGVIA